MDEKDEVFLKSLNKKLNSSTQCSEDHFEEVMSFFEETAQAKQPYAAVDNPPVLSYDEMQSSFNENIDDSARNLAREIYEHWKSRRLEVGNKQLITSLKVSPAVIQLVQANTYIIKSLKPVQIQMMRTHMYVFDVEKSDKFAKHVDEMPIVQKN